MPSKANIQWKKDSGKWRITQRSFHQEDLTGITKIHNDYRYNFFVELVRPSRKVGFSHYNKAAEAALKNGQV